MDPATHIRKRNLESKMSSLRWDIREVEKRSANCFKRQDIRGRVSLLSYDDGACFKQAVTFRKHCVKLIAALEKRYTAVQNKWAAFR